MGWCKHARAHTHTHLRPRTPPCLHALAQVSSSSHLLPGTPLCHTLLHTHLTTPTLHRCQAAAAASCCPAPRSATPSATSTTMRGRTTAPRKTAKRSEASALPSKCVFHLLVCEQNTCEHVHAPAGARHIFTLARINLTLISVCGRTAGKSMLSGTGFHRIQNSAHRAHPSLLDRPCLICKARAQHVHFLLYMEF